jgi:hypothetical protein
MLQKSLSGLYRSLLHDILKASPGLMPKVLPRVWQQATSTPWQVSTLFEISGREIRAALDQVMVENNNISPEFCFCFFIDGLDEYLETTQWDHKDLVKLLCSWVSASPRQIKLCVSSREHVVFMNSFAPEQRLRLHELTRHDMVVYVRDRLPLELVEAREADAIAVSVADKAQGIFLWVALVVKAIRRQLESGAGSDTLATLLEALPDELYSLYDHILQSLSWVDRRKAYRTFNMLEVANKYEVPFSLLSYSFFDDYETDYEFALHDSFKSSMDTTALPERVAVASKLLSNRCMGFLEVVGEGEDSFGHLDYTHRSVPEFLANRRIRDQMTPHLEGFNAVDAISQLLLAELVINDPSDNSGDVFGGLLQMRYQHGLDLEPPFTFFERLDTGWAARNPIWFNMEMEGFNRELGVVIARQRYPTVLSGPHVAFHTTICSPLHATLFIEDHPYPLWKLSRNPADTGSPLRTILLCYTIFRGRRFHLTTTCLLLDFLLQQGFVSAHTRTHWMMTSDTIEPKGKYELTIWQHFLVDECIVHLKAFTKAARAHDERLAILSEWFLRQEGIDLHFSARLFRATEDEWNQGFAYRVYIEVGREKTRFSVLFWKHEYENRENMYLECKVEPGDCLTVVNLYEWFNSLQVSKKSTLLQLLNRRFPGLQNSSAAKKDNEEGQRQTPTLENVSSHYNPVKKTDSRQPAFFFLSNRLGIISTILSKSMFKHLVVS